MKQSALNSNNLTLFIGYDGCRADAITFVKSKPNGVVFSNDMTNHYISNSINKDTVSGPGWISIFTGK
ncbi:hypothetical protein FACS1894218_2050 [Bacilli bacterium]|nr:hypothetical protein FACS1894218_2050 [Bacilli bacterium]